MTSETPELLPGVREFVENSEEPFVHHVRERQWYHPDPEANRCINIALGRTEALKKAAKTGAEWYFFLDCDVVPPLDSIEKLKALNLSVVGGWIPGRYSGFIGGRFHGIGVFEHFHKVMDSEVYPTELISLGCTLVRASLLEGHVFSAGTDALCLDTKGNIYLIADSGAFSMFLKHKKIVPYLFGGVVCRHYFNTVEELCLK